MENKEVTDLVEVPQSNTSLVEIEKSRAVQEVQASLVIAKKFPRDETNAFLKIKKACERISLAEVAEYAFPRGKETVRGPSIRLAEVMAQNWGNMEHGIRELDQGVDADGITFSIAQSYAWDKETNVRSELTFKVRHEMQLKGGGRKRLTDPRDMYEHVANYGARRKRACILAVIPGDIVDSAVKACRNTLKKGDGKPMADRIREMVAAFIGLGVTREMLEKRLGHDVDITTGDELVDLVAVHNAIRDKQVSRAEVFEMAKGEEPASEKVSTLRERLKERLGDKLPPETK